MIELIPYTGFIVNEKKYIAFHFHEFIFDWSQIPTLLLFHSPGLPQLLHFQRNTTMLTSYLKIRFLWSPQ